MPTGIARILEVMFKAMELHSKATWPNRQIPCSRGRESPGHWVLSSCLPSLLLLERDNAKNAIRCGANDGQPSAQAFAGRDNEMVRSRGHGAAVIEEIDGRKGGPVLLSDSQAGPS